MESLRWMCLIFLLSFPFTEGQIPPSGILVGGNSLLGSGTSNKCDCSSLESRNKFLQTTVLNLQTTVQGLQTTMAQMAGWYSKATAELAQLKQNVASGAATQTNPTPPATAFACPPGFTDNNSLKSCYKFVGDPSENWKDADKECAKYGARLVAIETKTEQDFLTKILERDDSLRKRDFWTSAHDMGKEGKFIWLSTGAPMRYTKWDTGNPDNGGDGNEDCVVMDHDEDFQWNDTECDKTRGYICEINY